MVNSTETTGVTPEAVLASDVTEPLLGQMSDADLLDAWNKDQLQSALAELINRYSVMVLSLMRKTRFRARFCIFRGIAETFASLTGFLVGCNALHKEQPLQRGHRSALTHI